MAKIKTKELRSMDVADLDKKIKELKMELMKENAQIATGTIPKSPGNVRNIKKTIARIHTILAEPKANKKEEK